MAEPGRLPSYADLPLASGKQTFLVRLRNFRCTNLPKKDVVTRSDPYVLVNFDYARQFRTKTKWNTHSPEWKSFDNEFVYSTVYFSKLKYKKLTLDVYDRDVLTSDDYIGSAAVDLHTLATGPVQHDLMLKDEKGNSAGRIYFDCSMEHLSRFVLRLNTVQVKDPPSMEGVTSNVYLKINPSSLEKTTLKSGTLANPPLLWKAREHIADLAFTASLRQILETVLNVEVKVKKKLVDSVWAKFDLPLDSYFSLASCGKEIAFNIPLLSPSGDPLPSGHVSGTLSYFNPPLIAPMRGGLHLETGIVEGASPLLPGLPLPEVYNMSVKGWGLSLGPDGQTPAFINVDPNAEIQRRRGSTASRDGRRSSSGGSGANGKRRGSRDARRSPGGGSDKPRSSLAPEEAERRRRGSRQRRRRSRSRDGERARSRPPSDQGRARPRRASHQRRDSSVRKVRREHSAPADLGHELPAPMEHGLRYDEDELEIPEHAKCSRCTFEIKGPPIRFEGGIFHTQCYVLEKRGVDAVRSQY